MCNGLNKNVFWKFADCPTPLIVGDGFCNDETNNPDCNYDGGDCCGSCVVTEHCTECQCLGGVDGIELSSPSIGDGYCQDGNNNGACNYDGGDCCGSCVVTEHCTECQCLGGVDGIELSSPSIGDGYCQEGNNIAECNYDGGDCCSNAALLANGYCNDETNIATCNYDGGDCCVNVNTENCLDCQCLGGGAITSPGYPHSTYDNNLDLYWLIQVSIGRTIEINFISFDVEYYSTCG